MCIADNLLLFNICYEGPLEDQEYTWPHKSATQKHRQQLPSRPEHTRRSYWGVQASQVQMDYDKASRFLGRSLMNSIAAASSMDVLRARLGSSRRPDQRSSLRLWFLSEEQAKNMPTIKCAYLALSLVSTSIPGSRGSSRCPEAGAVKPGWLPIDS